MPTSKLYQQTSQPIAKPVTKSGAPDKRYGGAVPVKKDGTADKRFK